MEHSSVVESIDNLMSERDRLARTVKRLEFEQDRLLEEITFNIIKKRTSEKEISQLKTQLNDVADDSRLSNQEKLDQFVKINNDIYVPKNEYKDAVEKYLKILYKKFEDISQNISAVKGEIDKIDSSFSELGIVSGRPTEFFH